MNNRPAPGVPGDVRPLIGLLADVAMISGRSDLRATRVRDPEGKQLRSSRRALPRSRLVPLQARCG
jgi:hypothetical protein